MSRLFLFSLKGFLHKRMRTTLSIVGVAVSAACVMLITTLGTVGTTAVNRELDSMGLNGISVNCDEPLQREDAELISKIDGVEKVAPMVGMYSTASAKSNTARSYIWGIDGNADFIITAKPIYGRAVNADDIANCRDVCMIDRLLAKELFDTDYALGETVTLKFDNGTADCEVIGVCEADSGILKSVSGSFAPYFVYAPCTSLQVAQSTSGFSWIAVQSTDAETEKLCKSIEREFESINTTVTVENVSAQRESLSKMLSVVTLVLSAIAGVSLVVSGLSIMTVMLSSVSERTNEIGIKKALGASRGTIMLEFLVEALTICTLGGIIGSVVGAVIGAIGSYIFLGYIELSIKSILLCAVCSAIAGAIFGCYPAYKASSLKPVDALSSD